MTTTTPSCTEYFNDNPQVNFDTGSRRVKAKWPLGEVLDDASAAREQGTECAVLSVSHSKNHRAFLCYLNHETYFPPRDGTVFSTVMSQPFNAVPLGRVPCDRYSDKRLREAYAVALDGLAHRLAADDTKTLAFFTSPESRGMTVPGQAVAES